MGYCIICDREHLVTHNHHVVPQAYGGENGPVVVLCPDHHNLIHRLATSFQSGSNCSHRFVSSKEKQMVMALVKEIVDASSSGTRKYTIYMKPDRHMMSRIKRLQLDLGIRSLEKTLMFCVERTLRETGL